MYQISADSDITAKAKGDYSTHFYNYSNNEFNGSYHHSGSGCGYYYSSEENGTRYEYSESKSLVDKSEHYESELHESRHSDGGAFYRVSFDGWANGGGNSNSSSHNCSAYDTHRDWNNYSSYSCSCDYSYGCQDGGFTDTHSDSCSNSNSSAGYDYTADWSRNIDGTKSSSVSNQVTGHNGYSYNSHYNEHSGYNYGCGCGYDCSYSCGYDCGYGCDYGCGCGCTYFDYNETVQYTGWGHQGGQVNTPFSVRWQPFNGSINNGDDCGYGCGGYGCGYGCGYDCGCGCGCGCDYSYHNASFSAPNFSVSMTEETYNGEVYEPSNVWHKGRGSYYYYGDGYLYSGSAPGSHIPGGSVPGKPSSYGMVALAAMPLNYNANPNFSKFALVDPEAVLNEKYPKPPEPAVFAPAMPQVTPEPPATPVVNDAPTLSNRIFGTLTTIGGIAEAAVGGIGVIAGIGSANPLLIGGGGVVGLNGIDNAQAGMRRKPVQTATSTAVEAVTGSHLAGEGTNLAIGLVGPGAVAKVATGKGLVASIKSVGSDAWKGLKNAGSSVKNWWKGTPNVSITIKFSPEKIQHEFKHAEDFGIMGNWSKQNGAAFEQAIRNHIQKENIQTITGTYRNTISVTHYYERKTGLNVMIDTNGNLVGAWKLGSNQIINLLKRGNVQ